MNQQIDVKFFAAKAIREFDDHSDVRMKQAEWDILHRFVEQAIADALGLSKPKNAAVYSAAGDTKWMA